MSEKKLPPGYKLGKSRPFYTSEPFASVVGKSKLNRIDHLIVFILCTTSVLVRLYKLPMPNEVVFDEVNIGGFVHQYFHGKLFVDVHPPLAMLMYYWVAVAYGYNGEFDFNYIGDTYDRVVPFIAMRMVAGISGVLSVVFTYLFLRNTNCGSFASFVGSFLIIIENSLVVQSRLILLDSPLILATTFTLFAFSKFKLCQSFTWSWYKYMVLTGIGLGGIISIKSSGMLIFIGIGIMIFRQLWTLLGDMEVSNKQWWKHLALRGVYFMLLPLTIYTAVFYVHFSILPYNGRGSGPVTPHFKATLEDSNMGNMPVEVAYGSTITLRHNEMESYLHSHKYPYKGGTGNQQVTLYGFTPDLNNDWEIHPKNNKPDSELKLKFRPVKDGEVIRLYHKVTGKYLMVNDVRPPISERDYAYEVSTNGTRDQLGDQNYEFKVRIISKKSHSSNNLPMIKLRATESVFQLVHQGTRCILLSHPVRLPEWGFGQNEVMCLKEPTLPNSFWYIEHNSHPLLDNDVNAARVNLEYYPFYQKLIDYHKAMWKVNLGLVNEHKYSSRPETWPFLLRGINYYSTNTRVHSLEEMGSHIYYLGNLAIYYVGVMMVLLISLKQCIYIINHLNPFSLPNETVNVITFYSNSFDMILCYFINYTPFFYMKRQLFLHHYLPALVFSIMAVSYFIEFQVSRRKFVGYFMGISLLALSLYCFVEFMPLIYGSPWTKAQCNLHKWFAGWDFDCTSFRQ